MINTHKLSLMDLIPASVKSVESEALAYALDPELHEIESLIDNLSFLTQIDKLPEWLIEELAYQWRVNLHLQLSPSLYQKRALVKHALRWHKHKGSPAALEEMIAIFFPESRIEEWYEYGGDPFFFRVILYANGMNTKMQNNVRTTILAEKNERSWLEELIVTAGIMRFINQNIFRKINISMGAYRFINKQSINFVGFRIQKRIANVNKFTAADLSMKFQLQNHSSLSGSVKKLIAPRWRTVNENWGTGITTWGSKTVIEDL